MSISARTFRIFISSTFNDLVAERNALQFYVFPRLREFCEKNGARFQAIDLRWGISNEASLDQQAMNICLDEISRCQITSPRPNFIILLGDRYGWMPPPSQIPENEFTQLINKASLPSKNLLKNWYILDANASPAERQMKAREPGSVFENYETWQPLETALQKTLSEAARKLELPENRCLIYQTSATHQEIMQGALQQVDAAEHVFCFFRKIKGLPQEFNFKNFKEFLKKFLNFHYPQGLNKSCQALLNSLLSLPQETTLGELNEQLYKMQKTISAELEVSLLKTVQQTLIDFSAENYVNFDEDRSGIDHVAFQKLQALKDLLEKKLTKNVFHFEAEWVNAIDSKSEPSSEWITKDHIGNLPARLEDCLPMTLDKDYQPANLCEAVWISLSRIIQTELNNPQKLLEEIGSQAIIQSDPILDEEGLVHRNFANQHLEHFVGRRDILAEIQDYLKISEKKILVVAGQGGSGKSTLTAKALQETKEAFPSAKIVYRFIGVTPGSSDARNLLGSLCDEIARRYDQEESTRFSNFQDLCLEFSRKLELADENAPLIIFLDSLDQLSVAHSARSLDWLPTNLPEHVHLIVSTRENEETFANLEDKSIRVKSLGGLSVEEGEKLLRLWLASASRTLQNKQIKEILDNFLSSQGNPLFLKLAFEEARHWKSYQEKEKLSPHVEGIIQNNLFPRLADEHNHGQVLVSHALGYLAASRDGLAEDELVDLLSRDLQVYTAFIQTAHHLPADLVQIAALYLQKHTEIMLSEQITKAQAFEITAESWLKNLEVNSPVFIAFLNEVLPQPNGPRLPIVLWSRLFSDLQPYLSERQVDGSTLLNFYHRELSDISKKVFLEGNLALSFHKKLAEYFQSRADPQQDGSWTGASIHSLRELPFQLTAAKKQDELFNVLSDFKFLEHKAEQTGINRSMDQNGQPVIHSEGVYDLLQDFELPLSTFYTNISENYIEKPPLILTARKKDAEYSLFCPLCATHFPLDQGTLGKTIHCENKDCQTLIKVNPFSIQIRAGDEYE